MTGWRKTGPNVPLDTAKSPRTGRRMAAVGAQFPWRWNDGTISTNSLVIWEMSDWSIRSSARPGSVSASAFCFSFGPRGQFPAARAGAAPTALLYQKTDPALFFAIGGTA